MLKTVVNFLNLKLGLLNYFDLTRCLSELKVDSEGKTSPKEYISNGNWDNIDFDAKDGVSYWRLRDEITTSPIESVYKAGKRVEVTIPLKLVFSVPRRKLTEDDAYSFDRIRQTITKQFNIDDGDLKTTLGCEKVEISSPTANGDAKEVWDGETENTGTHEPNYDVVFGSVDIDVKLIYKGSCLPTECEDVDSDILHSFDFCSAAIRDRLTDAQVTCLEDALCGVCADATYTNSDGSYSGSVASGGVLNIPDITVTDSDGSTSSVPSVQDIVCTPSPDATVENSDASYSTTVASGGTLVVPDTDISVNSTLVVEQASTIANDLVLRYTTAGLVPFSLVSGEMVVDDPSGGGSLAIGVFSDAGHTTPITEAPVGNTIYLVATPTDITPTNYIFWAVDTDGVSIIIYEGASNTTSWEVSISSEMRIFAEATEDGITWESVSVEFEGTGDADANLFIANAGITNPTEIILSQYIVTYLKDNNLWDDIDVFLPFFGGTASSHKYNIKNALDTDAAFRVTWNGAWIHDGNGATGNAINTYGITHYNISDNATQGFHHFSAYIRSERTGDEIVIGASSAGSKNTIYPRYPDNNWYFRIQGSFSAGVAVTDSIGYMIANRVDTSNVIGYKNGSKTTVLNAATALPSLEYYIGAENGNGTPTAFSGHNICCITIGNGLTDAKELLLRTLVNYVQTTLGRNVV